MTTLEKLKASTAWHPGFNLPLIPRHNNPLIYLAYCIRICRLNEGSEALDEAIKQYISSREILPGYIGDVSHDELYGTAYLSKGFAERVLQRFYDYDGAYVALLQDSTDPKRWYFRFAFFEPVMRTLAGKPMSIMSDLQYSLDLIWVAITAKPSDTSAILLRWLTLPQMEKHLFSCLAVAFFKSRLMKLGLTPKEIFSKYYLTEIPVMAEIAPEHFN